VKNITTPRTLAEAVFVTGYSRAATQTQRSSWPSIALATIIGAALAAAIVYGGNL